MAKKQITERALVEGLILAREREAHFIDTACDLFRQTLAQNMSRARALAMMSGGFQAQLACGVAFNFQPASESVEITCSGQVASFAESKQSAVAASR